MRGPTIIRWVQVVRGNYARPADVVSSDTGPHPEGRYLHQDDILALIDAAEADPETDRTRIEVIRARVAST